MEGHDDRIMHGSGSSTHASSQERNALRYQMAFCVDACAWRGSRTSYISGVPDGPARPAPDTQQPGMHFCIPGRRTHLRCPGTSTVEAVLTSRCRRYAAVSYTHLTLPTNREV